MGLEVTTASYTPENLFAGDFPVVTEGGMLTQGDLREGALLERGAGDSEWVYCTTPADAEGVLAQNTDASTEPRAIVVYVTGQFLENGGTLNWAPELGPEGGPIIAAARAALKSNNIYLG